MASNIKKGKNKKKGKVLSLQEFHGDSNLSTAPVIQLPAINSWADEMENNSNDESSHTLLINRAALPTAPRAARAFNIDESKIPNEGPFNAYIGNLQFQVTESDIRRFFKDLKILNVRLQVDFSGRMKGFGYVEFETKQMLIEALSFNELTLNNRVVKIDLMENASHTNYRDKRDDYSGEDKTQGDWRKKTDTPSSDSKDDYNCSSEKYEGKSGGREDQRTKYGNYNERERGSRDYGGKSSGSGYRDRGDRYNFSNRDDNRDRAPRDNYDNNKSSRDISIEKDWKRSDRSNEDMDKEWKRREPSIEKEKTWNKNYDDYAPKKGNYDNYNRRNLDASDSRPSNYNNQRTYDNDNRKNYDNDRYNDKKSYDNDKYNDNRRNYNSSSDNRQHNYQSNSDNRRNYDSLDNRRNYNNADSKDGGGKWSSDDRRRGSLAGSSGGRDNADFRKKSSRDSSRDLVENNRRDHSNESFGRKDSSLVNRRDVSRESSGYDKEIPREKGYANKLDASSDNRDTDSKKERPKLILMPRTKPKEDVGQTTGALNAIFGNAKPVDTAQREKEIEEKIKQRKIQIVKNEDDVNIRGSSNGDRFNKHNSQEVLKQKPGGASKNVSESELSEESTETSQTSTNVEKTLSSPAVKMVPAPLPKVNAWHVKKKNSSGSVSCDIICDQNTNNFETSTDSNSKVLKSNTSNEALSKNNSSRPPLSSVLPTSNTPSTPYDSSSKNNSEEKFRTKFTSSETTNISTQDNRSNSFVDNRRREQDTKYNRPQESSQQVPKRAAISLKGGVGYPRGGAWRNLDYRDREPITAVASAKPKREAKPTPSSFEEMPKMEDNSKKDWSNANKFSYLQLDDEEIENYNDESIEGNANRQNWANHKETERADNDSSSINVFKDGHKTISGAL